MATKRTINTFPDFPARMGGGRRARKESLEEMAQTPVHPAVEIKFDIRAEEIWLSRLYVEPSQRRKGLGGAQLKKLQELARRLRLPIGLYLETEDEHEDRRSGKFYLHHGFIHLRESRSYIWRP